MFKTNAPASVANAYVDKNVSTSTPGTKIVADDQNIKQDELTNAVESAALALDATGAKRAQLAQAINILGASASAMVDTGVADAYVVDHVSSAVVPPDAYAEIDGFVVVFVPSNINTGSATLNYAGLGFKPVTTSQGVALTGGEMERYVALQYNITSDRWELMFSEIAKNHFYDNTTSGMTATNAQSAIDEILLRQATFADLGLVKLATDVEAQALLDTNKTITPATLSGAFGGSNQSKVGNGYQKLPGGLIMQWGTSTVTSPNATQTFNYPIAFPGGMLSLSGVLSATTGADNTEAFGSFSGSSNTQFNIRNYYDISGAPFNWIALGH